MQSLMRTSHTTRHYGKIMVAPNEGCPHPTQKHHVVMYCSAYSYVCHFIVVFAFKYIINSRLFL